MPSHDHPYATRSTAHAASSVATATPASLPSSADLPPCSARSVGSASATTSFLPKGSNGVNSSQLPNSLPPHAVP